MTQSHYSIKDNYLANAFLTFFSLVLLCSGGAYADEPFRYPIMRFSSEQRRLIASRNLSLPKAITAKQIIPPGNISLLPLMPYTPEERNQYRCGNCWVWASLGVVEIARSFQLGVNERLSIQYLNSNFRQGGLTGSSACYGGTLYDFIDFYNGSEGAKRLIPWSNANAYWADWDGGVSGGYGGGYRSNMAANRIAITPAQDISSISGEIVDTFGVGEEQAINNIKNLIGNNRAAFFGFALPDQASWNEFFDFWDNESSDSLFNYDPYSTLPWNDTEGGAHAVVLIGYNDMSDNPDEHYWLLLNSWGTTPNRPAGTFKVKMHMNYDNVDSSLLANLEWHGATVNFVSPTPAPSPTPTPTPMPTLSTSILGGVVYDSQGNRLKGVIVNGGELGLAVTNENGEYYFYNLPNGMAYTLDFIKTGVTFQPPKISGTTAGGTQTAQVVASTAIVPPNGCTEEDTSSTIYGTAVNVLSLRKCGDEAVSRLRGLAELKKFARKRAQILRTTSKVENTLNREYSEFLSKALDLPTGVLSCSRSAGCRKQSYVSSLNPVGRAIWKIRNAADTAALKIAKVSPERAPISQNLLNKTNRHYIEVWRNFLAFPQTGKICE